MSTVATKPEKTVHPKPEQTANLPAIGGPRLPYHPLIEERYGIDKSSWKALVEAIFPNATAVESVILALSYCRARKLDPFKKAVHIVPIWDKHRGCMVDTVWPGIGELRTTAFRTTEYAGRDKTEYGPDVTRKVGSVEITFPEWAQVTVYRIVRGTRVAFAGPQVYWLETYATVKRNDDTPNEMWANRPRGQLDKCAEAAALRAAFPEEIGCDYIPEEVERGTLTIQTAAAIEDQRSRTDEVAGLLKARREQIDAVDTAPYVEPVSKEADQSAQSADAADSQEKTGGGETVAEAMARVQGLFDGADTPARIDEIIGSELASGDYTKDQAERITAMGDTRKRIIAGATKK